MGWGRSRAILKPGAGTRIASMTVRRRNIGVLTQIFTRTAGKRSILGDIAFVLFVVAQVCDGMFTYAGIALFGRDVEANPIVSWYIAMFGTAAALIGVKLIALICGTILHLTAMHRVIAVLVVVYAVGALWPWTLIFWR
jgi:hypothetical protein